MDLCQLKCLINIARQPNKISTEINGHYRVSTQKQDSQSNSIMFDCTLSTKSSDQQMTGLDVQMYEVNHTSIYSGIR